MNIEDYPSSDESDEEYRPSDGEKGSEEEQSGEEEDFEPSVEQQCKLGKRKRTKAKPTSRKRKGGIKLEGEEENNETEKQDEYNKQLSQQLKQEEEERKEHDEKKKTDSLWADFMKDVGGPKPKAHASSSAVTNSCSSTKDSTSSRNTTTCSEMSKAMVGASSKVTVTKEYDFAGETIKVSKEVEANSKEAKAISKDDEQATENPKAVVRPHIPGFRRTGGGGGLGSVLGKIGKKPTISTLEKSKLDWDNFKAAEGIEEELQIHNRGKDGFIERQQFLERTDMRQFEIEKSLRQKKKLL